jgi:UPF0271 protein
MVHPMKTMDFNCDMGESFGNYQLGEDEKIIKYISSANVACGFHAGDPVVMRKTVALAKEHKVAVGAHPGFRDLVGFGRRMMKAERMEIENDILYQIGALKIFVEAQGMKLQHVKPHGALYNMAVEDENVARAVVEAIAQADRSLIYLVFSGIQGEKMAKIGRESGLKVALEGYPDRAYLPTGAIVPRRQKGALVEDPDEIAERALRMASEGKVKAIDGTNIDLKVDTLCFHGDNLANVQSLEKIHRQLGKTGVKIAPLGTFL